MSRKQFSTLASFWNTVQRPDKIELNLNCLNGRASYQRDLQNGSKVFLKRHSGGGFIMIQARFSVKKRLPGIFSRETKMVVLTRKRFR